MNLSVWLMLLIAGSAFAQQSGGNGVPSANSGGGALTGAAGGVLSGTYPNPTLANPLTLPAATTGQIVNGVSYSANYPQSTLSGRINACVADAEAGTNGNTSHKCDSSGEAYAQTDSSGTSLIIGDAAGDKVTWIHPAYCNWTLSGFTGGTADAMDEYGGAAIEGNAPVNTHCMIFNGSSTGGMRAVFQTMPTTGGNVYFSVKGMGFANEGAGVASGATMVINSTNDGSIFEDLLVLNYVNGQNSILFTGTTSYGACCATVLNRIVAAGNYASGPILKFNTSNFSGQTAVFIENSSFGHPAAGNPNIECSNSTVPPTANAILSFNNIYLEGANGGSTPFIQINSCQNITLSGVSMFAMGSNSTQPGIQLNGTYNTALDVSGLAMFKGFAAYPAVAVQNNISGFNCAAVPCNVMTDAGGNLAHYTNGTAQGDVVNASVGFNVAGSPLAFANLAGTATAAQGGTGTTNLTGLRFANGASADTAASSSQVQAAIGAGIYQAAGSVASAPQYDLFYQPNAGSGATAAGDPYIVSDSSGDLIVQTPATGAVADSPAAKLCGVAEPTSGNYVSNCYSWQVVNAAGVSAAQTLQLSVTNPPGSSQYLVALGNNASLNLGQGAEAGFYEGTNSVTNVTFQAAQDGSGTEGYTATFRGPNTSGATGQAGNAVLQAGAAASTANNTGMTQGFATVSESFKVAAALAQTFEVVSMTTSGDVVQAAAFGSINNLGVAQTVGGTNTQVYVAAYGKSTVRFDGTPIAGDQACFPPASTGTAGLAHDNGSTVCPAGQKLGVITGQVSGTGSGATATVLLQIGN